jgi:sulfatase modifying factor 1
MVFVPGGTYTQEDTSSHSFYHTISAFKMGKYEVTYELWYTVYQWATSNGYTFANAGMEGSVTGGGSWPNYNNIGNAPTASKYEPVTMVNWRDIIVWCNAYSEMSGYTPVYYTDSGYITPIRTSTNTSSVDTTPGTEDNLYVKWKASGYRLPTEGEWQYAASYQDGSTWTPYNYASGARTFHDDDREDNPSNGVVDGKDANDRVSVYHDYWDGSIWQPTGIIKTADVGTKYENDSGIHDMSGNVWEYCWDWYGNYPAGPEPDYRGAGSGSYRLTRGGCWQNSASSLQICMRYIYNPYNLSEDLGFRFARTAE